MPMRRRGGRGGRRAKNASDALFAAAAAGYPGAVRQWLSDRAPLASSPLPLHPDGSTPFLLAAKHGQVRHLSCVFRVI